MTVYLVPPFSQSPGLHIQGFREQLLTVCSVWDPAIKSQWWLWLWEARLGTLFCYLVQTKLHRDILCKKKDLLFGMEVGQKGNSSSWDNLLLELIAQHLLLSGKCGLFSLHKSPPEPLASVMLPVCALHLLWDSCFKAPINLLSVSLSIAPVGIRVIAAQ